MSTKQLNGNGNRYIFSNGGEGALQKVETASAAIMMKSLQSANQSCRTCFYFAHVSPQGTRDYKESADKTICRLKDGKEIKHYNLCARHKKLVAVLPLGIK